MPTGDQKINIYPKKFLPQQQLVENFLEYLERIADSNFGKLYHRSGILSGGNITGIVNGFRLSETEVIVPTPLGVRSVQWENPGEDIPFENLNGIQYSLGIRYQQIPFDTEINPRTGRPEYTSFLETLGELGEPDSVEDLGGGQIRLTINGITSQGVNYSGRLATVWLRKPVSLTDAFAYALIEYDGTNNHVTISALGQGSVDFPVSTNLQDYQVFIRGISWTKRAVKDLKDDPEYAFLGYITGAGQGNIPTIIDTSGQNQIGFSHIDIQHDLETVFKDVYTSPSFDHDGLPNLSHPLQTLFETEHYPHSEPAYFGQHRDISPRKITTKVAGGVTGEKLIIQAINSGDEPNNLIVIKNSAGTVVAFIKGNGDAEFENLRVRGIETVVNREVIDGDQQILGNLQVNGNTVLGNDASIDTFLAHVVSASFDRDLSVGQDLDVARDLRVHRYSYLGDDLSDLIYLNGAINTDLIFQNTGASLSKKVQFANNNINFTLQLDGLDFKVSRNDANSTVSRLKIAQLGTGGWLGLDVQGATLLRNTLELNAGSALSPNLLFVDSLGGSWEIRDDNRKLTIRYTGPSEDQEAYFQNNTIGRSVHLRASGKLITEFGAIQAPLSALTFMDVNVPSGYAFSGPGASQKVLNTTDKTVIGAINEIYASPLPDDAVTSQKIREADGTSGQNTNTGAGVKTGHIQDGAVTPSKIDSTQIFTALGFRASKFMPQVDSSALGLVSDSGIYALTSGNAAQSIHARSLRAGTSYPVTDPGDGGLYLTGGAYINDGNARFYVQPGEGETIMLRGNNGVKMHIENQNGALRLVNDPWTLELWNVNQSGDMWARGNITANGSLIGGNLTLTGHVYMNNGYTLQAKNAAGAYETWMWPRWSDNNTYLNFGSGGNFYIRDNASNIILQIQAGYQAFNATPRGSAYRVATFDGYYSDRRAAGSYVDGIYCYAYNANGWAVYGYAPTGLSPRAYAGYFSGDITVLGTAYFSGKQGFVVDVFINGDTGNLKTGDVVKIVPEDPQEFMTLNDPQIPVCKVKKCDSADDPLCIGVVQKAEVPDGDSDPNTPGPNPDGSCPPGGKLLVVTFGAYAHCFVDAAQGAITVGDRLVSSSTLGAAKKMASSERWSFSRALESLPQGQSGYIAVYVHPR